MALQRSTKTMAHLGLFLHKLFHCGAVAVPVGSSPALRFKTLDFSSTTNKYCEVNVKKKNH